MSVRVIQKFSELYREQMIIASRYIFLKQKILDMTKHKQNEYYRKSK